ncbi:MAG: hypothetical protein AB1779_10655 [Candidatus Thermoplasmatota archaeon]
MQGKRILTAIEELNKWRERKENFIKMKVRNKKTIRNIEKHISYYETLLRDMKRELRPSKLSTFRI